MSMSTSAKAKERDRGLPFYRCGGAPQRTALRSARVSPSDQLLAFLVVMKNRPASRLVATDGRGPIKHWVGTVSRWQTTWADLDGLF
jgi:hypothetical protein